MKKLLLVLFGLVLVAAVGASIYVSTIDWNQHKNIIAQQFSEATGKKIVFEGPVSFKFLPTPYLNASNVKILNPSGGKTPLVEIPDLVANLSLAPLLKGQFDVQKMELRNPQINVEVLEGGKLNWQSDLTPEQRQKIEDAQIALNSVSIGNATLNFEDPFRNISLKLQNLNGEIIAQSIMGPYRIEGNYIKDNTPEGFAISLGQFSDSFATTLNLAITHPVSESYIRFDGSFMLANKVLNGNVIVESKKLKQFVQANFRQLSFDDAYDYPLAVTADINVNEQQLNLSNIVLKYGDTQGAGNLQMPFNDGFGNGGIKPRVDVAFNFTDLNLTPAAHALISTIDELATKDSIYNPQFNFDLLADVKSVRTSYKGQQIKNFETSVDWVENILTLNNLNATLPGETDLSLKGTVSAFEDKPFYSLDVAFSSDDFLKTLSWLEMDPQVSAAATYRKAVGNAKLTGNLQRIQMSPFNFTLDKSSVSGELGIKLDTPRWDIMLIADTDMINFDNYIRSLPDEEKAKSWAQRMVYRFSKLGFFNDFDMQMKLKMNLGIYENMPFENVNFTANLLDGKLMIENLQIGSVANSKIEAKGGVSGFGNSPIFEDFNYSIQTENVAALVSKMELKAPNLDYKKLNHLQVLGALTGNMSEFVTETNVNFEDLNLVYRGQVGRKENGVSYNGDLEIKHPDFVRMLNDFNFSYNPAAYSLGLFNLKTKINGSAEAFRANPLDFNIGFNTFRGDVSYEKNAEKRPSILTNMEINKFEIERFLNKITKKEDAPVINPVSEGKTEFLAQPFWMKDIVNYDFYKSFDLNGNFKIQELSYQNYVFRQAQGDVSLLQGNADIKNFTANYFGGEINASLQLQMQSNPSANGHVKIQNVEVNQMNIGGSIYALNNGLFNTDFTFSAPIESEAAFIAGLKANADFEFVGSDLKGWNLQAIYEDILNREQSEGLAAMVKENLSSGNTSFDKLTGRAEVVNGKFVLAETSMNGKGFAVSASGEGNLSEWGMNVLFNVKYDEPKYLPGFAFSLKGPINAPLLDVDVSALFNLYQGRQDKKEADIKAAEDAEKARLRVLASEQKKISEALIADVQTNLEKEINNKRMIVFSDETNATYLNVQQQLGKIVAELVQNSSRADAENVDEALLENLQEINIKAMADVESQRKQVADAYLSDVKKNNQAVYSQIIESYNRSKMLSFNYNTLKDGFNARLAAIETNFKPEEDVNIVGWQNFIEDKISAFENQDKKLLDEMKKMQATTDINEAEDYKKQLQTLRDLLFVDLRDMEQSLNEYKDYADKKVAAQEEAYNTRMREEEVQRKLEENTGSISIKKSGKTLTVRRDIEDIEKAEELADEKEIKVLDFSRPKIKVETKTPKTEVNVVKKGRVKSN